MIKFFFVVLFFSFAPLNLKAESSKTEAGFNHDARKDLDFCCDRSQKSESAHDLSDQESRRIVEQTLSQESESSKPKPAPGRGNR